MAKVIAIIMHETPKAWMMVAGSPATKGWVPKSAKGVGRPQHLFFVTHEHKMREVVDITLPAWIIRERVWKCNQTKVLKALEEFKEGVARAEDPTPEPKDNEPALLPWWQAD